MADVARDRGQLILVTGLLVAVAMISLVLLLNTAIFTENLASRGADQSGREAIEYRSTVLDGVRGVIADENLREHGSQTAVEDSVVASIRQIDNLTARSYGTGGTVVRINESTIDPHPGRLVKQTNVTREFRNDTGNATDWQLAAGVENTSGFTIDVNDTELVDTDAASADTSGAFHVLVDDGTNQWELFIYDRTADDEIAVATATNLGTPSLRCSTSEPRAVVEVMDGTVNGEACSDLEWAEGVSGSYDIEFRNGDAANGTYDLTVNSTTAVNATNTHDGTTTTDSPYRVPAVYSVSFEIEYRSPSLEYRADVRVAPGESE